jgi:hypothetical protein
MRTRERVNFLTQQIPDSKLNEWYFNLLKYIHTLEEEADDAFCIAMNEAFEADPDPEKWEGTPIEELAARWGIELE